MRDSATKKNTTYKKKTGKDIKHIVWFKTFGEYLIEGISACF